MPAKSQAQRKWAFGVKGAAWAKAHHFDNPGKLPSRAKKGKAVKKAKKKPGKRKSGKKAKKGRKKG